MSFDDGLLWLKNKAKKVERVFSKSFALNIKEGYDGATGGSTTAEQGATGDGAKYYDSRQSGTFLDNPTIAPSGSAGNAPSTSIESLNNFTATTNNALQKSNVLVNNIRDWTKNKPPSRLLNYNIFIDNAYGTEKIIDTINPIKCASSAILSNSNLKPVGSGFDSAYPNNFSSYNDAKNACKLWAADSNKQHFALSKEGNDFKCYTASSDLTGALEQYTVPQVGLTLASSINGATFGGLFYDGTIGIYNKKSTSGDKNIQLMKNMTIPTGYSSCDRWIGGAINTSSINANLGRNCSGTTYPPFHARYITMISNPLNDDGFIQISQIAAFTYNEEDHSSKNVASINNNPKATVTNKKPGNPSWPWRGKNKDTAIGYSIDGTLDTRKQIFYHSLTPGPYEIWQLDLSQEYPLYQVDFYNRDHDTVGKRADGSTLILENASRTRMLKIKMNGSDKQKFVVDNNKAVDYSPPVAHLDNVGRSQTFATSDAYAKKKGGRLATAEELQYYIMRQPSGELLKGDHWVAVTNGYKDGNDWIQIGNPGYGAAWTPLSSHMRTHGYRDWMTNYSNQPYSIHVFWVEPVKK